MAEVGMLGWRMPEDRAHERRYAMATAMPTSATPVVVGIPWYEAFDRPVRRGASWWIGTPDVAWGAVRGGHAVCLRPPSIGDVASAYLHYNQGSEGACVGFATARAATLCNRRLYDGFAQYRAAQRNDEWAGEGYIGSSVNGGLQGLRLEGAWIVRAGKTAVTPSLADGISAFVWARTPTEVLQALRSSEQFVRILNSWGGNYPREVRMPLSGVTRLMSEGGEFGAPVDRPGRG
jgi:hypothetical protein